MFGEGFSLLIRNFRELQLAPTALVFVFAGLLALASLRANAAWHFLAAQSISAPLFEAGGFRQAGFDSADQHLQRALARFPDKPDYRDLSGRLKELQAGQPGMVGGNRRELLQAAAQDYLQALAVRPLWPYSWANLLGVKSGLNEVDAEFRLALIRSVETGPWEPRVQIQVLESGLKHWDSLGKGDRALVQRQLAAAVTVQPRLVFERVRQFGRADLLCPLAVEQPQIEYYCKSAGMD